MVRRDRPAFRPGSNIAVKLPERHYAATLAFYRDVLGLEMLSERQDGAVVAFGAMRLHLDRVPHQSQTDVWLEVETDDADAARAWLDAQGIAPCPEVEPLPPGFRGFWIAAPAGIIHLVSGGD